MRALILFLLTLALLPATALAGEGDPLLSVDDLLTLEESYEAFLQDLGDLIISRGLLSPEERSAWYDAQMGDFYQNGGYGSILASYMPGMLSYVREEDTLLVLTAQLGDPAHKITGFIKMLHIAGNIGKRERTAVFPHDAHTRIHLCNVFQLFLH